MSADPRPVLPPAVMTLKARKQIFAPQQIFLLCQKTWEQKPKKSAAFSETQPTGWDRMPGAFQAPSPLKFSKWKSFDRNGNPQNLMSLKLCPGAKQGKEVQFWQGELDKIQIFILTRQKSPSLLYPQRLLDFLEFKICLVCILLSFYINIKSSTVSVNRAIHYIMHIIIHIFIHMVDFLAHQD